MAIFPGEPGLAGFIVAKDDGGGDDKWSYNIYKAQPPTPPPTNQHPTKLMTFNYATMFLQARCPSIAQPTVSKH